MFFENVTESAPDAIFGLSSAFNSDPRSDKVNLSVGVYRSPDLKTPIMPSVKRAEEMLVAEEATKDYLPIEGENAFIQEAGRLVFGKELWQRKREHCAAAQSIGGAGALRIGADFLRQNAGALVYLPDPTWPNHKGVFIRSGFEVRSYPYYDRARHSVDLDRLFTCLQEAPEGSVVVLHAVCHNPTGADLPLSTWKELSQLFAKRKLLPFFDFAYQGFDQGIEEDAAAIRLFAEEGHTLLVASSYSKNFTLYSERIGALFLLADRRQKVCAIQSQMKNLIRTNYSNPPRHGAALVSKILCSPPLLEQWEADLAAMRARVVEMRGAFARALEARAPHFSFLHGGKGLFSFCGLTEEQVGRIIRDKGIYMTSDGRVNVAGLNWDNLDRVVEAILAVL